MPSNSRPLGSTNAVEFVFLCHSVWQLRPCPLSTLGQGEVWPIRRQLRQQILRYRIAGLWAALTPLSSCFYLKVFGCCDRVRFQGRGRPDPKIEQLGAQKLYYLVCNNAVEFVFLSQGVWLLWAFIFFPLGNNPPPNWIILGHSWRQNWYHWIVHPWLAIITTSPCFFLKTFGRYLRVRVGCGDLPIKIEFWGQLRGKSGTIG